MPVSSELDLQAYAGYRRLGKKYWDAGNTLTTPPKDIVDLRLFLEGPVWNIGFYVENLFDERFPTAAVGDVFGPDLTIRIPNVGRQYGIEASYRF